MNRHDAVSAVKAKAHIVIEPATPDAIALRVDDEHVQDAALSVWLSRAHPEHRREFRRWAVQSMHLPNGDERWRPGMADFLEMAYGTSTLTADRIGGRRFTRATRSGARRKCNRASRPASLSPRTSYEIMATA
jgi:hypothetical protein